MQRPPRDPRQPIITSTLLLRTVLVTLLLFAGAFGAFLLEQQVRGKSLVETRTTVVNVIVMVECFYLLNCRSLLHSMFAVGVWSNLAVFGGIAAMLGAQLLFTHTSLMNRLFHSAPLDATSWAYVGAVGLVAYGVVELEKWVRLKVNGSL
jgi:Ca2+-transporting ATPase